MRRSERAHFAGNLVGLSNHWINRYFVMGGLRPHNSFLKSGRILATADASGGPIRSWFGKDAYTNTDVGPVTLTDGTDDILQLIGAPLVVPPLTMIFECYPPPGAGTYCMFAIGDPAGGGSMTGWKIAVDGGTWLVGTKPGTDWVTTVASYGEQRQLMALRIDGTNGDFLVNSYSGGKNAYNTTSLSTPDAPTNYVTFGGCRTPSATWTDFGAYMIGTWALYDRALPLDTIKSIVWGDNIEGLFDFEYEEGLLLPTSLEQEGFRGRNDDGSESGASWIAAQDSNFSMPKNTNFRVRFLINTSGGASAKQYQLEYRASGGAWIKVT